MDNKPSTQQGRDALNRLIYAHYENVVPQEKLEWPAGHPLATQSVIPEV